MKRYAEPYSRRVLRPRTEPKSYAEAPDIVLLPAKINGRQQNGNIDSDTDDEEMPPIIAIKVLFVAVFLFCMDLYTFSFDKSINYYALVK